MPNKRQILSGLTRLTLLNIARSFEFSGLTTKSRDDILEALMSKRSLSIEKILDILIIPELKAICREKPVRQ
jgi:hypothetical protein